MQPTVLYILGTSWCGSSLLNALLGTQPGVAAFGEVAHLRRLDRTDAWCARCRSPVQHCRLAHKVAPGRFYQSLFQLHPGTRLIVDSSKNWSVILDRYVPERQFRYRAVLLSKAPHQFARSYVDHERAGTVPDAFDLWIRWHGRMLEHLARLAEPSYRTSSWPAGPAIAAADRTAASYRELATEPAGLVQRLCELAGIGFDPARLGNWCGRPRNCVIGGNVAVYAQLTACRAFFEQNSYLGGKYMGRLGQIFLDEHWRADRHFVKQCLTQYQRRRTELQRLLPAVGQPSWSALVEELVAAASG